MPWIIRATKIIATAAFPGDPKRQKGDEGGDGGGVVRRFGRRNPFDGPFAEFFRMF